jgi:hypothetical protein
MMKMKFCSLLMGASILALIGTAHAKQPVALSDIQMDGVTAGAAATADAAGMALGDLLTMTLTQVATNAVTTNSEGQAVIAFGGALSQTAAVSALFQAAATSHADSSATLP